MSRVVLIWKRGASFPAIGAQLLDENETPIDLTGATVRFLMGPVASGSATLAATATVTEGTAGRVQHSWGTADLETAGLFYSYWEVAYSGGAIEKFPAGGGIPGEPDAQLIRVTEDLAEA